jgi:hypothetical protein
MEQRGAPGRVLSDMNLLSALTARDTGADTRDPAAIRDNPATIAWAADDRVFSFVWNGKAAVGVHLSDTGTPEGVNLVSASRFVLTASPYLGGVPANSSDLMCDSDPFLSANGAYAAGTPGQRDHRALPAVGQPGLSAGPAAQRERAADEGGGRESEDDRDVGADR